MISAARGIQRPDIKLTLEMAMHYIAFRGGCNPRRTAIVLEKVGSYRKALLPALCVGSRLNTTPERGISLRPFYGDYNSRRPGLKPGVF